MIKEKSCGAIVYKKMEKKTYFLLLKHNAGHWSFPKGHVENEETEEQTAFREIKEETNLEVTLDTRFRKISTYCPKENVVKDVIFFLGELKDSSFMAQAQESEIKELDWFLEKEALNRLTFKEDKKILKEAILYLGGKNEK